MREKIIEQTQEFMDNETNSVGEMEVTEFTKWLDTYPFIRT